MRCMLLPSYRIHIHLGIAMIGSNECHTTLLLKCSQNASKLSISLFNSFNNSRHVGCVPNHIRIGKINKNKIRAFIDFFDSFIGNCFGTHFWCQIMGNYIFATIQKNMRFAFMRLFPAAI